MRPAIEVLATVILLFLSVETSRASEGRNVTVTRQKSSIPIEGTKFFAASDNYASFATLKEVSEEKIVFTVQSLIQGSKCEVPLYKNRSSTVLEFKMTSLLNDLHVLKVYSVAADSSDLQVIIVDMDTCRYGNRSIYYSSDLKPSSHFVNRGLMGSRKNSVDLLIPDRNQPFLLSYDSEENEWSQPILMPALPGEFDPEHLVSFSHVANATSYLIEHESREYNSLLLVEPNRREISGRMNIKTEGDDGSFISTAYGFVSYCRSLSGDSANRSNTKLECSRRNAIFEKELSVEFELGYKARFFNMRNWEDGRIFILAGRCTEQLADSRCAGDYAFELIEIEQDGQHKRLNQFFIPECHPLNKEFIASFEHNGSLCARFSCAQKPSWKDNTVDFELVCFLE